MYTPSRASGFFDNVRNPETLNKVPSFDPENKNIASFAGYFDGYPPIYAPRIGFDYTQNYTSVLDYENTEEFPSLLGSKPPGFVNEDYYPPPGFSKPMKTKAPNPNAVSFIPSYLSSPPLKDEKEEKDLKEYGVRGILNLQKNLQNDKALLAKGKDLNALELNKKNLECMSSYLNSSQSDQEIEQTEFPEFTLPPSYFISKPILKAKMIKAYHIETLFYVFYNMPGELIQSYVADELYKRDWAYEPKRQLWFTNTGGEWKTFDISKFEIVPALPNLGPFLSKEDVCVKQRPLA
jgi:NOT2 / NOT3 / NOT5 family